MNKKRGDLESQAASGIQVQDNIHPLWSDTHSRSVTMAISCYYYAFAFFNVIFGFLIGFFFIINILNLSKWSIGTFVFCCFEPLFHSVSCCAADQCKNEPCADVRPYRGFLRFITFSAVIYMIVIFSLHYLEKQTMARTELTINIIYFIVCAHTFMLDYFIYIIYIPLGKYILGPLCQNIMAPICSNIWRGIYLCFCFI